jgi:DNA polymerase-3 subunit delta'
MSWDIFGHEWAVQLLREHVMSGQVRHAYLFTGPPGIGRRTLALRLAQAINCPQPLASGEPCRTCRTCERLERMQHPDLSVVAAESEGGTIKVEQVRELQHKLSLAPYEARFRVALLLRFQEANLNAANALLKTLEEPPDKVVLLLTADAPEALLPTVVSRCEVLRLRPMPLEQAQAVLLSRGAAPERARLLAHLTEGRIGAALRLLEDGHALEERERLLDDLHDLLARPLRARFAYAERLGKDKEALRRAFLTWLSFWRDALLLASGSDVALANLDREVAIKRLADQIGLAGADAIVRSLEKGLQGLEQNLNPRLLVEVTLLEWPRVDV